MFTSYIEVGMDKALQIYNPNQYSVRFEDYAFFILQYASGSTVGNFRSLRRPISDDERITIPSGQTVALVSSPSAKITPYIPNTNFYGVSLGSFFKFTGNDPVFLAEFKEGDTDEAVDSGEIGVIFDVVGDTSTTGPWSSGDVSTDQQAIVRKSSVVMSGNMGTWEYTGTGGAQYSWDATEWETKLVEGSGEGGIDATNADLTFLGYHYQETFEVRRSEKTSSDAADVDLYLPNPLSPLHSAQCSSHDQCPFNPLSQLEDGFCYKDQSCKRCQYCVEDADAYGGTCPEKCPAQCSGEIPKTTCPDCGDSKAFIPAPQFLSIDLARDQPSDKLTATVNVTWCSSSDYGALSPPLTDGASANITLHFFDAKTDERLHDKVHRIGYPSGINTVPSSEACDGDFEYRVTLPIPDPYLTIKSSVLLYDECQVDNSEQSSKITLDESSPTWFTSQNALTRTRIVPVVAGSTSETAVVQWQVPLLNCDSCSIVGYNVYMSQDDEDYVVVQENTVQTVALLRGLTTGKNYRFKVSATTSIGTSKLSYASSVFVVAPEAPDSPPLVYFEAHETSPFRSVDAIVVKGEINGAPITEYTLEYDIDPFDFSNPSTVVLSTASDADKISSTGATFKLSDLIADTQYKFKATATNSVGDSEESNEFDYRTADITPSSISFSDVLGSTFDSVVVTVSPGEKFDDELTLCTLTYWVDGSLQETTVTSAEITSDNDFVFSLSALDSGANYKFRASVLNQRGFEQFAPQATYTTDEMRSTILRFLKDEDSKFSSVRVTVVPGEKGDGVMKNCTLTYFAWENDMKQGPALTATMENTTEANNFAFDITELETNRNYCFLAEATNNRGVIQRSKNSGDGSCNYAYKTDAMAATTIEFEKDERAKFSSVDVIITPGELEDAPLKSATLKFLKKADYENGDYSDEKVLSSNAHSNDQREFKFVGSHDGVDDHLEGHLVNLEPSTAYCFSVVVVNDNDVVQTAGPCIEYDTESLAKTTIQVIDVKGEKNLYDVKVVPGEVGYDITNYTLFWGLGKSQSGTHPCDFDGGNQSITRSPEANKFTFSGADAVSLDKEGTYCMYSLVENVHGLEQFSPGITKDFLIGECEQKFFEIKDLTQRDDACFAEGGQFLLQFDVVREKDHASCDNDKRKLFSCPDGDSNELCIIVNCPYLGFESIEGKIIAAISGLGAIICFTAAAIFFHLRKKMTIKIAQPVFLVTFCVSAAFINLYSVLKLPAGDAITCFGGNLLFHMSVMVYYGVLVVKLYRVYQLFLSKAASNLKRVKVTAMDAMKVLVLPILLNFSFLTYFEFGVIHQDEGVVGGIYYATPIEYETDTAKKSLAPYDSITVPKCANNSERYRYWRAVPYVVDGLLLIAALVFLSKVKGVSKKMAEKAQIGNVVLQSVTGALLIVCILGPKGVPKTIQVRLQGAESGERSGTRIG